MEAVDQRRGVGPLDGMTVGLTADRRWEEQADLFARRGATVLHAPTMRTVELTAEPELRSTTTALAETPPDVLVVTTGAGFRSWMDAAAAWGLRDRLLSSLREHATTVVCRGAKGASAARGAGLDVAWRAEHESMEEVVAHVQSHVARSAAVALQLFDPDDHWSTARLRSSHPALVEVPVYRWLSPDDVAPVDRLVAGVLAGQVDAVTFTSQPAVRNLFSLAGEARAAALRAAFADRACLAVCVGPVCAAALVECGVTTGIWPEPPRLVPMVRLAEQALIARSSR